MLFAYCLYIEITVRKPLVSKKAKGIHRKLFGSTKGGVELKQK